MNPTSGNFDMLARLLDVASLRHKVIAQNVANINTPGYRQLEISFENSFAKALEQGETASLKVQPTLVEGGGGPERADGNNVDIDVEMTRLEKNTLLVRVYMQLLASDVATQRSAIIGQ